MKTITNLLTGLALCLSLATFAQNRNMLIEEGTGTWCQYCPRGEVKGHEVSQAFPGRILLVAVHSNDIMEIPGLAYYNNLNFVGIPAGNIDRTILDIDPLNWQAQVAVRANIPSPVNVNITRTYNPNTRELIVVITAEFVATLPAGDYRIGGILIEDGVTGPAPYYNQTNSYSGGGLGPMGGYENLPNPVHASKMVYDYVARGLLGSFLGQAGSLPATPQQGQNYSQTFTLTVDTAFDERFVRVYGFVNNAQTGEILNCGSSEYALGDHNALPFFHCDSTAIAQSTAPFTMEILCHDPDNDTLTITSTNLPSWLSILPLGTHDALLTGTPANPGIYTFTLQVSDGSHSSTQNMEITVVSGGGSWVQLGPAGYSDVISKYISPSAIDTIDGILYSMAITANHQASIYQYDGTNWSQLGSALPAYSLYSDIMVNPVTGEPWIFLTSLSGSGSIYRFTGGSWTQVGNSFTADSHLNIRFNSSGTPYAAYQLNGVGIGLRTFDGTNWTLLQNPVNPDLLGWTRIEITHNGEIILLVGEFPVNYSYHSRVFHFDGTTWSALGSLINSSTITTSSSRSLHNLAIGPNNEIYVACAHPNGTNIYEWTGSDWGMIAENIDNGMHQNFDLKVNTAGLLYLTYLNGNSKATCQSWDGNQWSLVGLPDFTPALYQLSMIINPDGYPSVTYVDLDASMGKLSSKRFINPALGFEPSISEKGKVNLYPNPAGNIVNLSNSNMINKPFIIHDMTGRLVKEGLLEGQSFDVSTLDPGLYLFYVEGYPALKFLKQ
ncbi:MAG: Omp28-related outer membrane protein [Bacteroidales bacterium]